MRPSQPRSLCQSRFLAPERSLAIFGDLLFPGPTLFWLSVLSRLPLHSTSASDRRGCFLLKVVTSVVVMGKSDFLTPKAIANRIKSKGLQKLRWYCQMCQKQCRDEVSGPGIAPYSLRNLREIQVQLLTPVRARVSGSRREISEVRSDQVNYSTHYSCLFLPCAALAGPL